MDGDATLPNACEGIALMTVSHPENPLPAWK
jgi:hypothetical protein